MDKNYFTSFISETSPEKRKEFLEALQPIEPSNESKRILLDGLYINASAISQKLLKEWSSILENSGSMTANALTRDCINQNRVYNLLKNCVRQENEGIK